MDAVHSGAYGRVLTTMAALGLLAALLLPGPANAQDSTAPTFLAAHVNGSSLELIYDEALDTNSTPAAGAYNVVVANAGGVPPSSVSISGAKVALTLDPGAMDGDTVRVTYIAPSSNPVQDAEGNAVAALTGRSVTNQTGATNSKPLFNRDADTRIVAENTARGMEIGVAIEASGDTLRYELTGTDASSFRLDSTSNKLKTRAALDHETKSSYSVVVTVTDRKSPSGATDRVIDDAIAITIIVIDVNEKPTITTTGSSFTAINKPENTPPTEVIATYKAADQDAMETLTWYLRGTDGGDFNITKNVDGDGELTFKVSPDFESPHDDGRNNEYGLMVAVGDNRDDNGNDQTGENPDVFLSVTITVDNEDEPGTVTIEGTLTGGEELTASVTDPDGTPTGVSWRWARGDSQSGPFSNISGATSAAYTLVAADVGKYLRARARYKDPESNRNKNADAVSGQVRASNDEPEFNAMTATRTLPENSGAGVNVAGGTITASDDDSGDTLTYSLASGMDASSFEIDSSTGQIKTKAGARHNFNFEATKNSYSVTVNVRDSKDAAGDADAANDDSITVTINLTDVNETPVISGMGSPTFKEIEDIISTPILVVATYSYTDEDMDSVTWAVTGTDAAHFNIDPMTGELSFSIRPNFEEPADVADSNMMGASNNMYEIVVEAMDDNSLGGLTGTFTVTVTVENIDERPDITSDGPSHTTPSVREIEYDFTGTPDLEIATYTASDEEGETVTWDLSGDDADDFTMNRTSGVLSFKARPNFEDPEDDDANNVYLFTVRATEAFVQPGQLQFIVFLNVTVAVTDVNERPDVNEDTVASYVEIEYDFTGTRQDVHTFSATDYDDMDTFTWSLGGVDAAHLAIGSTTGVLTFDQSSCTNDGPLPDFEEPCDDTEDGSPNTYNITAIATDNHSLAAEYAVTVTVTEVNEQPELTGNPLASVTLDEHDATLDATGHERPYGSGSIASYTARDEEGAVTWRLTGTDSGDFQIDSGGTVIFKKTPNFEAPEDSGGDNVYEFNVVATDTMSGSPRRTATVAVTVTVMDVEEAGTVAISEGDESPGVDDTVTFNLTDPDGDIDLTRASDPSWEIQRGSSGSWSTADTSITRTATYDYIVQEEDSGEQLRVVVTYKDRRGEDKEATSEPTDVVTRDPRANVPPRLRQAVYRVEEGPPTIDFGTIDATDRDGDTLTFVMLEQNDYELFDLSPRGRLRAVQAIDFEDNPSLTLSITISDGKDDNNNTDTSVDIFADISFVVRDVEEPGAITFSPVEPEVGVVQTAILEDSDGGLSGQMWQWARSENGRTGWSNISGATSSTYTAIEADENFYLRASVTYTDNRGSGKSAEAITERPVPSENRRPTFPSTEDGERTVPENTRAGTNIGAPVAAVDPENNRLTYSLTGADAAAFDIVVSSGQIRVKDDLDFEAKSSYTFTIEVHDGLDGSGATSTATDDDQSVTITVENVDEPGTVTLTTDTETIKARVPVTAELSDDDNPTGVTWQWARSPDGRSDWANIGGATSATFTPTLETDAGHYIRATASYTDPHGSQNANEVSSRVGDPPPVNSAPAFPSTEDGRREVAEDAGGGASFGAPVVATDLNEGDGMVNDPLAYSLTGTDAASFEIDTSSGQLRVASNVTLDYEGKRSYRVTVRVTDGRDENGDDDMDKIDDTISVTVSVANVNEAPVVSGDATASVAENSSAAVATYRGDDPERDTLTWSTSGGDFWISQRGQLHFRTPPSFEVRTSYTVTVTAEDDGGLSDSLSVNVTVTDVEEEGVVTISPLRGWDGTQFRAEFDDDDGQLSNISWQWQRSSNRSSWANVTTGGTSSSYLADADDVGNYLRAVVTYADRRGSGKDAEAALTARIEADADRPTTNNSPEFADTATERSVGQGTAAGRSIGAPVRATDPDPGDILTYSLNGQDANDFDIEPRTGQLRTRVVLDYDAQGQNTYEVTVEVHDGFDNNYSPSPSRDDFIDVTITVTEVAQRVPGGGGGGGGFGAALTAPSFVDGFRTSRPLAVDAEVGDAVGDPVAATHPDNDDVTYSLSGANASLFAVDEEAGQIRLGQAVSIELGQTYTVNLTATDSTGTGAIIIVDIEVAEPAYHPYDLNRNGTFERDEVIKAVADYFAGLIEKAEALEVFTRYLAE